VFLSEGEDDREMKERRTYIIVMVSLMILNLIQAGFTELLDDEAYYWMYSQHLDWGYFDHPPMVALMIKSGSFIFHNTLGIRFFSVIAFFVCTMVMYALQKSHKPNRLIILILSTGLIQIGAILAVPDVFLVLFSTLFLWIYRAFLQSKTWRNAFLLGICMAALMYSKYHGILLIGLTIVANFQLLTEKKFWIASLLALVLFLPHLYWQYAHGFASIAYHLIERYPKEYHLSYTTDYLLGQLFLFGPLTGWMVLFAAYKQQTNNDVWLRTLKYVVFGTLGFFFLASFKGNIEPYWTSIALIPGMLLLHDYMDASHTFEGVLYKLFPFSLGLILLIRAAFFWDFVGDKVAINEELHGNEMRTSQIKAKAKGYPVYFLDSYQAASKYIYYQHMPATSYNSVYYRNNQYDYWQFGNAWQADSVLVVGVAHENASDSILRGTTKIYTRLYANPVIHVNNDFYKQMPAHKKMRALPLDIRAF
jgi:hypothetical protein